MTDIFCENAAGAEQILLTFLWLCWCFIKTFWSLCFACVLCVSMAICISASCFVLKSLPFSKTCEKVFEMSHSKGFNVHSMFANVRYKLYCPKQCRIYLMKNHSRPLWRNFNLCIKARAYSVVNICSQQFLPDCHQVFFFPRYSDRELKVLLESQ